MTEIATISTETKYFKKAMKNMEKNEFKKVIAEIVKIEGEERCSFGHKAGERFEFDEFGPDKKMCVYALAALMPAVNVLLHNGKFPWLPEGEELYWGCPHPGAMYKGLGQIIFRLNVKN